VHPPLSVLTKALLESGDSRTKPSNAIKNTTREFLETGSPPDQPSRKAVTEKIQQTQ